MNAPLPPERDLPGLRHVEIRQGLVRAVNGRPARHNGRWLVPVATAASVAAVVAAAVVLPGLGTDRQPLRPAASGRVTPSSAPAPVVPGVTHERARQIVAGCAASYGWSDTPGSPEAQAPTAGAIPPTPSQPSPVPPAPTEASPVRPAPTEASPVRPTASQPATAQPEPSQPSADGPAVKGNGLQLYNMITDAAGTQALLLGRDNVLSCDVGGPVRPYLAQGGTAATTSLDWLYGPIVVDQSGASPGEGADGKYGPRPAFWEAAGRVSADVARVTLTVAHKTTGATETVEAKVLNGTFQARLVLPTGSPLITGSDETGEEQRSVATSVVPTLRAYDADGRLVGQIVQSGKDHVPAGCYATPSGQVIYGVREGQAACKPATSWRP